MSDLAEKSLRHWIKPHPNSSRMRLTAQAITSIEHQLAQSVPWELYIDRLRQLPVVAWTQSASTVLDTDGLCAIAQAALGDRALINASKRNLAALREWLAQGETGVTIDLVRDAARVMSAFCQQAIKIRDTTVQALNYQAPPHQRIVRLLYQCNQQLKGFDAAVSDLMSGSGVCVIHPFLDGNGRVSRLYFLRALLRVGCPAVQAVELLKAFDGVGSRESIMVRQAATYAGDPLPFFQRWKDVLNATGLAL
jgi:hypothetical protein